MTGTRSKLSDPKRRECLLGGANSVSKQDPASFEGEGLACEASTLPLSYTRRNTSILAEKLSLVKIECLPENWEAWVKLYSLSGKDH